MSGIAAIFDRDFAPIDRAEIDRMLAAIAHRGPDGSNSWARGPVALGHAAFRTTPESLHEVQPLFDEPSGICLTLDGRIDNRDELGDALRANGARLTADSDAEMVLRAYQLWGEDCAIRLIGDFALVIWDERNRIIFAARDAIGVRPLYYHCDSRRFVAGSEPREIVEGARLAREPNEGWIAEYLNGGLITRDETPLRGVMALPPAHCMT
ncbi:MAG: asparagine synthetase B, partial [Candidatus Binataceae bacterium]|nr:asparagine synthetase B [Candidatus Binataceae bacterium]